MKRASSCLFGLAFGDALGAPAEFLTVPEIVERFPPAGPSDLPRDDLGVARVTDDTHMALAVGEALRELQDGGQPLTPARPLTAASLESALRRAFVAWWGSPDNDRAPGMTCLRACEGLAGNRPWWQATVASSKGCGASRPGGAPALQ